MAEETSSNPPVKSADNPAAEAKPEKAAAKPKKEKPPAVEGKPFAEFIEQDYFPALQTAFKKQGIENLDLTLVNQKIPIRGLTPGSECWQVVGSWNSGQRQFNLYFLEGDIQGPRAFSCTSNGAPTSTLEPFLVDERKITLDLLVFGVMQRLNGQKWLTRN